MKVVVIGAYGHIGTFLVPMLIENGFETVAISRGIAKPYENNPLWDKAVKMKLDRTSSDFIKAIININADVVIDLINFDINETKKITAALKETNCKHYIYCSSCWANGRAMVLPVNANSRADMPLCDYGKDKLASELFLHKEFIQNGFPYTSIRPGQISGAGWDIINPWGNISYKPFQIIKSGKEIKLPNFGMETIHHVHGYDVAQVFCKAVIHRQNAIDKVFDAASGGSITLYGYAKMIYEFFGFEPMISYLPWDKWCEYEGNPNECEHTFLHIARSGSYSIEKERELLEYKPKYTNIETIKLAVQSYIDRGVIK